MSGISDARRRARTDRRRRRAPRRAGRLHRPHRRGRARRHRARRCSSARARSSAKRSRERMTEGVLDRAADAVLRVRPARPPRPRRQPDRPRDRGDGPARRGRRGLHVSARPQRGPDHGRGRRLPRRPHAPDAARRAARRRPGQHRRADRAAVPRCRSATSCSAACSTASAGRSTAAAGSRETRCARPPPRPPAPLGRARIEKRLDLGVRALDTLVPCGRGQRLGIFAGSGVGKSSLLGMIARSTSADVNVICLVGERGREVREFVERDLGDGARALGRRRRHLRRAGARADQGRLRRDGDRRALPRPGRRRAPDDGLGHPLRHGPARGRPRDRRAARDARLHAERLRPAAAAARARGHARRAARSPASTPSSSRATT